MRIIRVTIEGEKRNIGFIYCGDSIFLKYMKKDLIKALKQVLENGNTRTKKKSPRKN